MELQRVANAGVLLKMDGVSILLDGLCRKVGVYQETPEPIWNSLLMDPPDVLCFTHWHEDHFSEPLVKAFYEKTLRPIFGPEKLPYATDFGKKLVGSVRITPVESRHLGRIPPDLNHVSYVLEGSKCVWFMGDAAPTQIRKWENLPRPHVLIAPFAYALSESAWRLASGLAEHVVLVHMPPEGEDPDGIFPLVRAVTGGEENPQLTILQMGQKIAF